MGAFDDLVPGGTSQGGNFDEFISTTKIPKSENILQKAVQGLIQPTMNAVGNTVGGAMSSNPWQVLKGLGSMQSSGYQGTMNAKNELLDPLNQAESKAFGPTVGTGFKILNEGATDPLTYMGGEVAGDVGKKAMNAGEYVLNPSKAYGKALSNAKGTVDFLPHIMQAIDDPVAGKLIDKAGILEKFGGTTMGEGGMPMEKLSNLSAEESQNVINSLKDEVTKAVREGTLKPKQLQVGKLFGDLSQAQNDAFEGMKGAKFGYGLGKNTQKTAKGIAATALAGGGFEGGRKMVGDTLKHLFGL